MTINLKINGHTFSVETERNTPLLWVIRDLLDMKGTKYGCGRAAEEIVPQCGYCQPGFMMATVALLNKIPDPTDEDIDRNIVNVCRCGTYYRMRKAIHRAAELNKSTM